MPLSGHLVEIEDRVLVHQTERYELSQTKMLYADKGRFLSLLPLFQEGQLSVTGESMCTKYWLTA